MVVMKENKTNPGDFKHVGSIVHGVLDSFRTESGFELAGIFGIWDNIVGDSVAKNARPAGFKGKILLVNVVSSVWIQELQFHKKEMIKKLNGAFGKELICDIKFKVGPV
jgi:predicted nucleic acid-binding Zn ribbon protein